eukprot:SAG11_NODE_3912_length_2152_cov_13.990258_1_plen_317_part_00
MMEWVRQLTAQLIKKFGCMDAIRKWSPLPTDPLLKINLKQGKKGFQSRRYKTPVHLLPHLKEFIDTMMGKGFIRKSSSPFSSPVLIVPKPRNADGSSRGFRLVTDFRALNEIAESHQHPIPEVGEMYAKLRHAKYISTLGLKNGYWNAGLDEESKPLTAFATEYGCYEYNVIPQGLISSASFFQSWVEAKLRRYGVLFEHVSLKPAEVSSGGGSDADTAKPVDSHTRISTTGTTDTIQNDTKCAYETESGTGSNSGGRPSKKVKKNRKTPANNSHATKSHENNDTGTDTFSTVSESTNFDEHGRYSGVAPHLSREV